eukprot:TRINITY_DN105984_c0_g1_i1.p1 TRINITY_DN105984_c0_g1~~TRINITY_DN105984_c0_g1_i1.p1  ORF type:complete len:769 (-),score=164.74 TRINITY_DN105984_c0_g1_i1:54-2360(-)
MSVFLLAKLIVFALVTTTVRAEDAKLNAEGHQYAKTFHAARKSTPAMSIELDASGSAKTPEAPANDHTNGHTRLIRREEVAAHNSLVSHSMLDSKNNTAGDPMICEPGGGGIFLPLLSDKAEQSISKGARAFLYIVFLLWLFIGVSVIADVFMAAIEKITSAKKLVYNKEFEQEVTYTVWNGTVANLTLMALGSSAPEILLSLIELLGNNYYSGDLGPGTIVGSAAFNLLVISGVCVMAVPEDQTRRVKFLAVYVVTTVSSVFAYVWLIVILEWSSPNVVSKLEAGLTFVFFPCLVVIAFFADKGYFSFSAVNEQLALKDMRLTSLEDTPPDVLEKLKEKVRKDSEQDLSEKEVIDIINKTYINPTQKRKSMVPAGKRPKKEEDAEEGLIIGFKEHILRVDRDPKPHKVAVELKGDLQEKVTCQVKTESDSAMADRDFQPIESELVFEPGKTTQEIEVNIKGEKAGREIFRVILSDATGDAKFSAKVDGGEETDILTVVIDGEENVALLNQDQTQTGMGEWKEQFIDACSPGEEPSLQDWIMHIIAFPFKITFALVPPPTLFGGWLCFFVALAFIGALTAVVGDAAALAGCNAGINDEITAITLVALGTSLPDTFASQTAAKNDPTADNSLGNIMGSNSVNVFLGLGLPWLVGACFWEGNPTDKWKQKYPINAPKYPKGAFIVKAGGLSFSVQVFTACALSAIAILAVRRRVFGGELGGKGKNFAGAMLIFLWIIYVTVSISKSLSEKPGTLEDPVLSVSTTTMVPIL